MTAKEIKKLADACRKAGIKSFKNSEVEFTLSDLAPTVTRRRRTVISPAQENISATLSQPEVIADDTAGLSEEEILFWSSSITEENQ
jgi:hypothetical protein